MLTAVHVIGPKNNSSAGTKWQGAVFEICERHPRGAISPCALERHVLYLAASATAYGGGGPGKNQRETRRAPPTPPPIARPAFLPVGALTAPLPRLPTSDPP